MQIYFGLNLDVNGKIFFYIDDSNHNIKLNDILSSRKYLFIADDVTKTRHLVCLSDLSEVIDLWNVSQEDKLLWTDRQIMVYDEFYNELNFDNYLQKNNIKVKFNKFSINHNNSNKKINLKNGYYLVNGYAGSIENGKAIIKLVKIIKGVLYFNVTPSYIWVDYATHVQFSNDPMNVITHISEPLLPNKRITK